MRTADLTAPVDENHHVRGTAGGRQLVLYGDFESPHTAAAAQQGRFWEMHDVLFRNQLRLESEDLRRYAERLALDLERFEADVADDATRARIERDVESGEASGVDGTPSLFVDGRRYPGPRDTASLEEALRLS
jgi:protein-disulfide isomerase